MPVSSISTAPLLWNKNETERHWTKWKQNKMSQENWIWILSIWKWLYCFMLAYFTKSMLSVTNCSSYLPVLTNMTPLPFLSYFCWKSEPLRFSDPNLLCLPLLYMCGHILLDPDIQGVDLLNVHLVQHLDVEDSVQNTVTGQATGLWNNRTFQYNKTKSYYDRGNVLYIQQ
jgi:hypothetical protein